MDRNEFNDNISLNSRLLDLLVRIIKGESVSEEELNFLIENGYITLSSGIIQPTNKAMEKIKQLKNKMEVLNFYNFHPYLRPAVTVDGIIYYKGKLVLIKRGNEPYKGLYALPGGYVSYNETVEDAFLREMKEEIGVDIYQWKLFTVLSDPKRDPRGHTISIVFEGTAYEEPKAGDDASEVFLIKEEDAIKLNMAFDHQEVIKKFIQCKSLPR